MMSNSEFSCRTVPASLRVTAKSSHFLLLKASEQICTGLFLLSVKPSFTWVAQLQIFCLWCKSTIHLVCVMTGPGVSCVILSSTAQSRDAPPPSWLQPWWSLLVWLSQTCWVILEKFDRQFFDCLFFLTTIFCRMHFTKKKRKKAQLWSLSCPPPPYLLLRMGAKWTPENHFLCVWFSPVLQYKQWATAILECYKYDGWLYFGLNYFSIFVCLRKTTQETAYSDHQKTPLKRHYQRRAGNLINNLLYAEVYREYSHQFGV